jgi:hypothetical protein
MISGIVFVDRFVSQPLTEYIFLGGTPHLNERIYLIANVFRALKRCVHDLKTFYKDLKCVPSPRKGKSPSKKSVKAVDSFADIASIFPSPPYISGR